MTLSQLQELDFQILDWIRAHLCCAFLDLLMPKISFLGNAAILWIVITIALLCVRRYRQRGIALAAGLVTYLIIGNTLLKNLIARSRPCWMRPEIGLLIRAPRDYSFPSGHTMAAFISATILMHYDRRWGTAAYITAALIGFSRLYLYVHFPSDVLGGAVLGVLTGLAVVRICEKVWRKEHPEEEGMP